MRVIIAGSRGVSDLDTVETAMRLSGLRPTAIVCGMARGADLLGKQWADDRGIPVHAYPADWSSGRRSAGHERNRVMGDNADALVAVWDGSSPGTEGMISYAQWKGLQVYVFRTDLVYTAYCDGASRKDGRGGWGASIRRPGEDNLDVYGGDTNTTNNRMELMGPIETLWMLPEQSNVVVVCDSQYVVQGMNEYLDSWRRCGWRTTANKPLKNSDLWMELSEAVKRHESVRWRWVKGHTGDEGNERADALAQMGVPDAG